MKKVNILMRIIFIAGDICLGIAIYLIVKEVDTPTGSFLPFAFLMAAYVLLLVGSLRQKRS